MKTASIVALAAAGFILAACTTTDQADEPPPSTSGSSYIEAEWVTDDETPDPGATIQRAIIEGTVDGQPVTIIEFTKSCFRSGDGDELSVSSETRGYGYEDYNTGVGVGNFEVDLVGLRNAAPIVKRVNISQVTGPETVSSVYVSNNVEGEGNTGAATATSETPDTYTITGSAPDPVNPTRTTTFTARATCLQPAAPAPK